MAPDPMSYDAKQIAKAAGGLTLAGAPEGFDALVMADIARARGGLTAFPALRQGSADAFCQALLEATGVLLLPGSLYGESWAKHFRIGFGRVDFRKNCERLAGFCQNWNPAQSS